MATVSWREGGNTRLQLPCPVQLAAPLPAATSTTAELAGMSWDLGPSRPVLMSPQPSRTFSSESVEFHATLKEKRSAGDR